MKDDLVGLSPIKKLAVELAVGFMLILGSDIYIDNFYGVLGIGELPFVASILITLFTMIVVVNAYNLIDGVDGLSGGIGVIALLYFWGWIFCSWPLRNGDAIGGSCGKPCGLLTSLISTLPVFLWGIREA